MISICQLNFAFPASDFRLCIDELKIGALKATAIVGPSGSGKTTLLNLMAGLLVPDQGQIQIEDRTISEEPDSKRRQFRLQNVGMVFQNFELIDYLTVLDNVLLPCRVGSEFKLTASIKDKAAGLLDSCGLASHTKKSVTKLSQGERQRVAICRALLTSPSLILADEPTGNLDPVTSNSILDMLLKAVSDLPTTLVMVTHDHSLLPRFDAVVDFNDCLATVPSFNGKPQATVGD